MEEEEEEEPRPGRRGGGGKRELCRDSYVGDVTSLLTLVVERAIGNGRQTVLAGIGSAVLWYDPFCDDDDDGATTTEKRKTMASRKDSLLASCPVALPEGARVHGMRREPALDDAEGNRFGVVVWGGNFASALALRVPTCIDEEETIESASESDASSSSRTTGFECEFVVSIGQTFSHWVHDCKVCAPDSAGDEYGHHSLAVALSDNSVERWTLPWNASDYDCVPRCLGISRCAAESLLYCAALRGETWKQMRVCAGTAFGELLVWFCGRENKQGTYPYASLQGHNGGIMRCRFSEDGKFVVSASEDRTIRIFALPNVFKETKEGGSRGEEKEKSIFPLNKFGKISQNQHF